MDNEINMEAIPKLCKCKETSELHTYIIMPGLVRVSDGILAQYMTLEDFALEFDLVDSIIEF